MLCSKLWKIKPLVSPEFLASYPGKLLWRGSSLCSCLRSEGMFYQWGLRAA